MTRVEYTRHGLRYAEVWFNPHENLAMFDSLKADIIVFKDSYVPINKSLYPFRNGIIRMNRSLTEIQASFDKGFAYETRRAEKEGIASSAIESITAEELKTIFDIYARFCAQKQIGVLAYRYFQWYLNAEALKISVARQNDTALQYHLYFSSNEEIILLASFPGENIDHIKKTVIGYANRSLHWFDIQQAHHEGKKKYNLGGMGNSSNDNTLGIAKFKTEMGPETIAYYHGAVGRTLAGKIYLGVRKLWQR